MRVFTILFFLFFFILNHGQTSLQFEKSIPLHSAAYVGTDYNDFHYHYSATVLTKESEDTSYEYSNFLYGEISSVDITNPLQVIVFYREFNVVVVLDSRLNELNVSQLPYDISYVAKGAVNHFWLYRLNTQLIENFNYKTNRVVASSQPLQNYAFSQMQSTENYLYISTDKAILVFDYLGNLTKKIDVSSGDFFQFYNRDLFVLYKQTLKDVFNKKVYSFPKEYTPTKFFINNNRVYIYHKDSIAVFSIPKK